MSGTYDAKLPSVKQQRALNDERERLTALEYAQRRVHRARYGRFVTYSRVTAVAGGFMALTSWFSLMFTANGIDMSGTWAVMMLGIVVAIGFYVLSRWQRAQYDVPLFLKHEDASAALASLSLLTAELKRETRTHQSMTIARDRAASLLQAIHGTPLTGITKGSYDPDVHSFDEQWRLLRGVIGVFDSQVAAQHPTTVAEVEGSVRSIVRHLRPILARYEIEGSSLDLHGAPLTALDTPERAQRPAKSKSAKPKANSAALPAPAAPDLPAAPEPVRDIDAPLSATPLPKVEDAFTPVEGMLNVSAEMSVAAIRMLILRVKTIDRTLMPDLDVQSSNALVDQHIPSLVKAYQVAHDLAPIDERDDVRAEFARTLRVVRDTLTDVLERHAREARRMLENEGRFLAARSGQTDI